MKAAVSHRRSINAEVMEYVIPPIKDMLVLGRNAPIGCIALRRSLELLIKTPYEHIEIADDDILSDILVRAALLRRLPREELISFVLKDIRPMMGADEVLHVTLDVKVQIQSRVHEVTQTG
ncbi:hypothetical protein [Ferrovum sp.]|uniref:hypothetical protein n=1 Tax=Ferrovum sp. TaxID=2609467 RepID=UPI00260C8305|nr:hypothetical protein [Ferrovum sp.]